MLADNFPEQILMGRKLNSMRFVWSTNENNNNNTRDGMHPPWHWISKDSVPLPFPVLSPSSFLFLLPVSLSPILSPKQNSFLGSNSLPNLREKRKKRERRKEKREGGQYWSQVGAVLIIHQSQILFSDPFLCLGPSFGHGHTAMCIPWTSILLCPPQHFQIPPAMPCWNFYPFIRISPQRWKKQEDMIQFLLVEGEWMSLEWMDLSPCCNACVAWS